MTDDRNFGQYHGSRRSTERYITFREYLQNLVGDERRTREFEDLVKVFGLPVLEQVLEGKTMIEAKNFLSTKEIK